MATSALVTGATGFAGSHLVDHLLSDDVAVTAWCRPDGTPPQPVAGLRWQAVDILNPFDVRRALSEALPDCVYHCAGASHVGQSWRTTASTFATNVRGTHYLVEALRALRQPARLLVPSSALVYAAQLEPLREDDPLRPSSPYGVSKLAQELVALDDPGPVHVSIARAFNHLGPRQSDGFVASSFARRIAEIEVNEATPVLHVGNLEAQRDLTDVRDTVRAYRLIVEQGQAGRCYNVCSGRAVRIKDLLDMLLARARARIEIEVNPDLYRPNDNPIVVGDPSRLQDELGWRPLIALEQTLDDLLAFWRQRVPTRPA